MFTDTFNPQRQYHFILRQFSIFQNRWAITTAAVFGLLLVISFTAAIINPVLLPGALGIYKVIFFFGGLIFTSQIFSELHSPTQSYSLLTLPASTFEKMLGSWLITSPLFIFGYSIISFTIYFLALLIAGEPVTINSFFAEDFWETISSYIVIQTIFLWGACYFRRYNFLKTGLALMGLFIAIGLYTIVLGYFTILQDRFVFSSGDNHFPEKLIENTFKPIIEFLYWAVLGPYMLVLTYFTLKERQV